MKQLLLVIVALSLSGCSILGFNRTKPTEVITVEQERTRLALDFPAPLQVSTAEWILITPDNAEQVWKKLRSENKHPVLFAVTSEGYEQLSFGMADMRNYIATQRMIIMKYQQYYEPAESPEQQP